MCCIDSFSRAFLFCALFVVFFFSSRRRHTRLQGGLEFRRVLFRSTQTFSRPQAECRYAIGAQVDRDRGRVRKWEEETPNAQGKKEQKEQSRPDPRLRFYRTGRRGQDDADRRARAASPASRTESAHRDSLT